MISSFTISAELISATGKVAVAVPETISTINAYSVQVSTLPAFLTVGDSVTLSVDIRSTGPAVALPSRVFVETDPTVLKVTVPATVTTVAVNGIGKVNILVTALAPTSSVTLHVIANATAANLPYVARTSVSFPINAAPANATDATVQTVAGTFASVKKGTVISGGSTFIITLPENYKNASSAFALNVVNSKNVAVKSVKKSFQRGQPSIENQITLGQFALQEHIALTTQPALVLAQPGVQVQVQDSLNNLNAFFSNFIATYKNATGEGFRRMPNQNTSVVATALALNFIVEFNKTVRVDANLVASSRAFVQRFRTGFGGFNNTGSNMNENTTNTFIILNLVRSGAFVATEFASEVAALKAAADAQVKNGSVDAYFLALLGQTLYALNRPTEGLVYGDILAANVNAQGVWNVSSPAFTASFGNALTVEVATAAVTLLGNNAKWAAVRTRALTYLQANLGSYPATQGTLQAVRLLDAQWATYKPVNGAGSITVYVNGVNITNGTNFTDAMEAFNVAINQRNIANANVSSLFYPGAKINVTFAIENFTVNKGVVTDILVPAFLVHSYAENITNSTIPKVMITSATLGPRASLAAAGKALAYTLTLNNTMSVSAVEITVRFPSIFNLDTNGLTTLKNTGVISSWDASVAGEVLIQVPQLPAGPAVTFKVPFVNFALPSVITGNTSVNLGSVTIAPAGVPEAAVTTTLIKLA